ncbi:uncharacterized protein LOC125948244 [Anopheles darlingi]|uniref:uncharacterized protein LOC125948244 n=1 Tax=Anopheles darlingi TaxID=43151 RepID=UPI00210015C0|nr:uncharacterized protein LOC125948244 [Anopheles darlingi]
MASKITLLTVGLLLVNVYVEAQQYQIGGRRNQDRQSVLRSSGYDDGRLHDNLNRNDLYDQQRYGSERQNEQDRQDRQDRRGDYRDDDREDYSYGYAVRDELSGDIKSQQEVRQGDRVRGQYRTVESDGTERIVDYTADDRRGFNAVVRHQPSVGSRAQLIHTLQPAVLIRPASSSSSSSSSSSAAATVDQLLVRSSGRNSQAGGTPILLRQ